MQVPLDGSLCGRQPLTAEYAALILTKLGERSTRTKLPGFFQPGHFRSVCYLPIFVSFCNSCFSLLIFLLVITVYMGRFSRELRHCWWRLVICGQRCYPVSMAKYVTYGSNHRSHRKRRSFKQS